MQSLILATSLVMSTPVTIDDVNNVAKLDNLINDQAQHVSALVHAQTKNITQDTFLVQAKMAINISKEYAATFSLNEDDGAE